MNLMPGQGAARPLRVQGGALPAGGTNKCDIFSRNSTRRPSRGRLRSRAWLCGSSSGGPSSPAAARSVRTGLTLQGCANMCLADGVRLGKGCHLYAEGGTLELGEDTALSPGVTVDASGGLIRLGKQVAVGPGTVLRASNHRFDSLDRPIMLQGHSYGEILIEDDVWIAANCTITPGTRIGRGAVIGPEP
ncbi:MAG: acyltransferase [Bilophila sp.]